MSNQDVKTASRIGSLVSSLVQFAMRNADQMIIDKDGNVIWQSAFDRLAATVKDPDNPTLEEICNAIEPDIPQKTVDNIHSIVMKLPFTIRAEISAGVATARSALYFKKSWKEELIEKKQGMILTTVRTAKTIETYNLLATHPNILTLVTAYIFRCLDLDYSQVISNPVTPQPQISLPPSTTPVGA